LLRFNPAFMRHWLFFWLILPFPVFAQTAFTPQTQAAYRQILALRLPVARQQIRQILGQQPDEALAIYLENYLDILPLLIEGDEKLYRQTADNENERLKKIRNSDKNSPYFLFMQAEIRLQWAMVKLRFGEQTGAFRDFQKAYRLIHANLEKFPDFIPQQKTLGLLNVLLGSVPESYQWAVHLLGLRGDVEAGLKALNRVRQSDSPYRLEADMICFLLQSYVLKSDNETFTQAQNLYQSQSDNLLLCLLLAMTGMKEGQGDAVLQALHHCPKGSEYLPVYWMEHLKGTVYLQKANYTNALFYFKKFLQYSPSQNARKDAHYKLFTANWLYTNDLKSSLPYLDKVLQTGKTLTEADKYAQRFAEKRDFPAPLLMQSRLAFDGGYYEQALHFLENCQESSFNPAKDKAEFTYRKGRIHQKMKQTEQAIPFYERAIVLSEGENYYFGANAALQLGYIFREKGEKAKAIAYFRKALSFRNHEYKNSIDAQAKTALREMEK
jgi:tetratricopeptide (TPR) repeat protein